MDQTETRRKFNELYDEWERDTMFLSSVFQMTKHPAYQELLKNHELYIDFVIEHIKEGHHPLLPILYEHFQDGPEITPDMQGRMSQICKLWIKWIDEKHSNSW